MRDFTIYKILLSKNTFFFFFKCLSCTFLFGHSLVRKKKKKQLPWKYSAGHRGLLHPLRGTCAVHIKYPG